MTNINAFDFATGSHTYTEGQIWEECAGPASLGYFTNRNGKRIPIVGLSDWPWLQHWHHTPEAKLLVSETIRSGMLDRSHPQAAETFAALKAAIKEKNLERYTPEEIRSLLPVFVQKWGSSYETDLGTEYLDGYDLTFRFGIQPDGWSTERTTVRYYY